MEDSHSVAQGNYGKEFGVNGEGKVIEDKLHK